MKEVKPMVVADPLAVFQKEGMLKLIAPAKTNLFLGVGSLCSNGFHEVTTVMHALSLHDVLHIDHEMESAGGLVVKASCYWRENLDPIEIASDENLVVRAIRLLSENLGRSVNETISIRIEKHIPLQAGLGGGSSNAAAALIGVAQLWGIEAHAPEVLSAAAVIGSDVSFFLYGGCVCLTGTGETYSHRLDPMKKSLVLIKPTEGVSTRLAYQMFDEAPVSIPEEIAQQALVTPDAKDVPLFNNLTQAAETVLPELAEIRQWAEKQENTEGVLLSGSGSATFVVCDSFDAASRISSEAQKQGWWARATMFTSVGAAIIPKSKF